MLLDDGITKTRIQEIVLFLKLTSYSLQKICLKKKKENRQNHSYESKAVLLRPLLLKLNSL